MSFTCTNLDEFLSEYGDLLAAKARDTLAPLHVPSRDGTGMPELYRKPFPAQSHVVEATCKALRRQKACQMVAEMGCIDGDAVVGINRAGKGYSITLEELHYKFQGGQTRGRRWDRSIPTMIRSLCGDRMGLNRIVDVYFQGVKPVVKLTLASGKTLRLTADHEVCVLGGEITLWARADSLMPGAQVATNGTWLDKDGYVRVGGMKGKHDRWTTGGVYEHILVMEQKLGRKLAEGEEVHHVNRVRHDNRPENLSLEADHAEHMAEHRDQHIANLPGMIPVADEVVSVVPDGASSTYDVVCDDPHRNFVANGIVVHNCGKTFMSVAVAHALAGRRLTPHGVRVARMDHVDEKSTATVEIDPWTYASIDDSSSGCDMEKATGTFDYAGEKWATFGSATMGVPGRTAQYSMQRLGWRVTPAAAWAKAIAPPTVLTVGVEGSLQRKARDYAVAEIAAGRRGIVGKVRGKAVVFHTPVTFVCKCPRAYRTLVICPGQLLKKWAREIVETVPGAIVYMIDSYKQVLALSRKWDEYKTKGVPFRPMGAEYYIIGRDCLKLSCGWKPVYVMRKDRPGCFCPKCGLRLAKKDGLETVGRDWLDTKTARRECYRCGERLWQDTDKPKKYSPSRLIGKRLRGFFDLGIIDEAHEYKSGDSLQADAIGGIAGACKKIIPLTGTLVGGYAWHVRAMLFRVGVARTMLDDGLGWSDEMEFNKKYGRIETKITTSRNADAEEVVRGYRSGRGGKKAGKSTSYVRPGIMPTLFRHLLWNSVFLGLDEVADNLPRYEEKLIPVAMDDSQREAYDLVDAALTAAIKDMVRKGNKKALGTILNCLLCYPDYPFHWGEIGYWEQDENMLGGQKRWVGIITPPDLPVEPVRPKEREIVDYCLSQKALRRQTWVYVCYTDKRDCIARLERSLRSAGLRVAVMRASVHPRDREEWIEANGPGHDVILSHPQLVQTGLDFFVKSGRHNFCSIAFYQTGYNLFTLMQAARRAWRIGQMKFCEVAFFYYENSMQSRAIGLMGKKMVAARALNGQFSAEGLAAMAGDDAGMEMELAKSLASAMPEDDGCRAWARVGAAKAAIADDLEGIDFGEIDFDDSMFESMLGEGASSC